MRADRPPMSCNGCGKNPEQIHIYVQMAQESGLTDANEYVWRDEGTLNRKNGHFLCDECYINAGQPSSPRGWKAP